MQCGGSGRAFGAGSATRPLACGGYSSAATAVRHPVGNARIFCVETPAHPPRPAAKRWAANWLSAGLVAGASKGPLTHGSQRRGPPAAIRRAALQCVKRNHLAEQKSGSTGLMEVYHYADAVDPEGAGPLFMDTPGFESGCRPRADRGGANLIASTNRARVLLGSYPSPTIKLASNTPDVHQEWPGRIWTIKLRHG